MTDMRWKLEPLPPVEHRVLGLDRRLVWPTLAVAAFVLFWTVIMPAVDQSVDRLEIAPDTVFDVAVASFHPAPGWVLAEPPSPVGESKDTTIVKGSVTFRVQGAGWNGTAAELLDRVSRDQRNYVLEGSTYQVRTAQGVTGVARKINGPDFVGLLAAFVDSGGGIAITVKGPADASEAVARPVAEMIQGLSFKSKEQKS